MKLNHTFILLSLLFFYSLGASEPSDYLRLEEEIPDQAFVYIGSSPREIIVYDPQSSPLLEKNVELFISTIPSESSLESILEKLMHFVLYKIFDPRLCNENETEQLIKNYRTAANPYPEIPLDIFLAARIGLCRHIALCSTLMLDKLSKKRIIQGKAFLVRGPTPQGRHAWSLFLSEKNAWHIDPYWGLIEDAKTLQGWQNLCSKYGLEIMEQQKLKWN